MAGITAAQADAQLTVWLAASTAVASGQAYSVNGRTLTRADAQYVQRMVDYWDKKCQQLGGTTTTVRKIKVYGATPA